MADLDVALANTTYNLNMYYTFDNKTEVNGTEIVPPLNRWPIDVYL